jgi:cell pole-organizing protein PopZ
MDFDVSIEEIEHESPALAESMPLEPERKEQDLSPVTEEIKDIAKETLGDIGAEIDMVMQDKLEEVTLTKNEEEVLLQEGPVEEILSDPEKGSLAAVDESRPAEVASEPEPLPAGVQQQYGVSSTVTTEAIVDAVVSEFRKDLPILLEGIVRPVVQELLQEIVASTRQEIPGIVEKVIREEIERLKKL